MPDEKRLIEIEIKLAHQDKSLEELNDVVYKQQQQIDLLQKSLSNLTKRLQSGTNNDLEIGPPDDKPPHY
jgi:SlyX protein